MSVLGRKSWERWTERDNASEKTTNEKACLLHVPKAVHPSQHVPLQAREDALMPIRKIVCSALSAPT